MMSAATAHGLTEQCYAAIGRSPRALLIEAARLALWRRTDLALDVGDAPAKRKRIGGDQVQTGMQHGASPAASSRIIVPAAAPALDSVVPVIVASHMPAPRRSRPGQHAEFMVEGRGIAEPCSDLLPVIMITTGARRIVPQPVHRAFVPCAYRAKIVLSG